MTKRSKKPRRVADSPRPPVTPSPRPLKVPRTTSRLPLHPTYPPMDALSVKQLPIGDMWQYEPKWDGFRCIAFRDGDTIYLQSKSGQALGRYFPEVVAALKKLKPTKFVIDGELVIPVGKQLSFDDLLMRIHPAASRVEKLSKETPATYIVFDLLVDDSGNSLADQPLKSRRKKLDQFAKKYFVTSARVDVSPCTSDVTTARQWLSKSGPKLDGVIAKRIDLPYQSGERTGMQKVKKLRTADCVVGGFRFATEGKVIGSLLLGLYDKSGLLNHVGFTSSFTNQERKDLVKKLKPFMRPPGFTGNKPGGPSRWSTKRSEEWEPLDPKLVVEVRYDHFSGGRFRHGTKFLRWRPDKKPTQCKYDQIL